MSKLTDYLQGSKEELSKVDWPSREATINHTLMVIGVSLAVALFLGAVDLLLSQLIGFIIQ